MVKELQCLVQSVLGSNGALQCKGTNATQQSGVDGPAKNKTFCKLVGLISCPVY